MTKKIPSWIKSTQGGGLYIDTSDPEWKRLFIDKVEQIKKSQLYKDLKKYGSVKYPD